MKRILLIIGVIDILLLTAPFVLICVRWLLNGCKFDYGTDDRDEWTDDDEHEATAEYLRSTPDA